MMEHSDQVAWGSPTGEPAWMGGWDPCRGNGGGSEGEPKKEKRGGKGAVKGITKHG